MGKRLSGVRGIVVLLAAALSGCATMSLNEGAANDRAKASAEKARAEKSGQLKDAGSDYAVIPITAEILAEQAAVRQKQRPVAEKDPLEKQIANYDYRVAPYDILSVTVWDHPELTIPAGEYRAPELTGNPVTSAGEIFYPHVGLMHVAGKTLAEIREELTQRLSKVVTKPQLDVRVAAFRGLKVQVTGQVTQPSTLPITDLPMRVLDAVNLAHGFTPNADQRHLTLTRNGEVHSLDLQAVNEAGDLSQNWLLQNGDIVFVPDMTQMRVFVLGEVQKPMAMVMPNGRLTLADALGGSEWLNPVTANAGRVYVIRGDFQKPQIFKLDARSADALLLATQFQLRPTDVVYVAATDLANWSRVIAQIVPSVQLLWYAFDLSTRSGKLF